MTWEWVVLIIFALAFAFMMIGKLIDRHDKLKEVPAVLAVKNEVKVISAEIEKILKAQKETDRTLEEHKKLVSQASLSTALLPRSMR